MQTTVLGAHNLETRETRHTCFLIDGVLGVDAGSIVTSLDGAALSSLGGLLLTHHHFDHTRDLPTLGLIRRDAPDPLEVLGLKETLSGARSHILDGDIYPDLTQPLNGSPPRFLFRPVAAPAQIQVLGYTVKIIPVPHPVPAVGYIVASPSGGCIAFSGDTGGDLLPFFSDAMAPGLLFVDVTFPNRMIELAEKTGHLTPGLLEQQLTGARKNGAVVPRIVAVHRSLGYEAELLRELKDVQARTGTSLEPGFAGMVIGS